MCKVIFKSRRIIILVITIVCICIVFTGCSKAGPIKLTYSPPATPFVVSFNIDPNSGSAFIGAGIATPVGVFAIEQGYKIGSDVAYIIFRNRKRGTDQVFRIANDGHVDMHIVGEHKLRLSRGQNNSFIIDAETISGQIDITVSPESSVIARVDWGKKAPDFILTTAPDLLINSPSFLGGIFSEPERISIDSIQSIEMKRRWLATRAAIVLNYKFATQTKKKNSLFLEISLLLMQIGLYSGGL